MALIAGGDTARECTQLLLHDGQVLIAGGLFYQRIGLFVRE
jgi:hypothetical protein